MNVKMINFKTLLHFALFKLSKKSLQIRNGCNIYNVIELRKFKKLFVLLGTKREMSKLGVTIAPKKKAMTFIPSSSSSTRTSGQLGPPAWFWRKNKSGSFANPLQCGYKSFAENGIKYALHIML